MEVGTTNQGKGVLQLRLGRSGFIGWQYGEAVLDGWEGLLVMAIFFASNWAVNLIGFRAGWTIYLSRTGARRCVAKHRFPSRAAAVAAWDDLRQRYGIDGQEEPPTR